jgi:hypothetical protein
VFNGVFEPSRDKSCELSADGRVDSVVSVKSDQGIVGSRGLDQLIMGAAYTACSNDAGFRSVVNEGFSF